MPVVAPLRSAPQRPRARLRRLLTAVRSLPCRRRSPRAKPADAQQNARSGCQVFGPRTRNWRCSCPGGGTHKRRQRLSFPIFVARMESPLRPRARREPPLGPRARTVSSLCFFIGCGTQRLQCAEVIRGNASGDAFVPQLSHRPSRAFKEHSSAHSLCSSPPLECRPRGSRSSAPSRWGSWPASPTAPARARGRARGWRRRRATTARRPSACSW